MMSVSDEVDVNHSKIAKNVMPPFAVGLAVMLAVLCALFIFLWPTKEDLPQVELAQPAVESNMSEAVSNEVISNEVVTEDIVQEKAKISELESKVLALQEQLSLEQAARQVLEDKLQKQQEKIRSTVNKKQQKPNNLYNTQEKNILKINSDNYTVQLLGASDEEKIQEFIRSNQLTSKAQYFKTTYKSKPWYILIYGTYPDKISANRALDGLPQSLRKLRPWTRQYKSIQKIIATR